MTLTIKPAHTVSAFVHLAYGTKVSCLVTTPRISMAASNLRVQSISSASRCCLCRLRRCRFCDSPRRVDRDVATHSPACRASCGNFISVVKVAGLERSSRFSASGASSARSATHCKSILHAARRFFPLALPPLPKARMDSQALRDRFCIFFAP